MARDLLNRVAAFQTRLRGRSAVNVNDRHTKSEAIALASDYFNEYRPHLVSVVGESTQLRNHDQRWQDLIRLAHGSNQRRTYLKLLGVASRELRELSVRTLARAADQEGPGLSEVTPAERQLISTLESLLPTAAASYRQGLLDLRGRDRLSYRGTASEFRESLREVLDYLAPDDEVIKQQNFKLENGRDRPTMKQKTSFVLLSRGRSKTQRGASEKSIDVIETLTGEVVRATYERASLATHLETTRAEVFRIKRYVDTVLFDLLEVAEGAGRT